MNIPQGLGVIIALLLASCCGAAPATTPAPLPEPGTLHLTLTPAPLPDPALKYRLLPTIAEQIPGNAAPLYLMTFLSSHLSEQEQKLLGDLLAAPRDRFALEPAKTLISSRQSYFANLELAARHDRCNWELPIRQQGVATLLPHLQPCRDAARLIALKARVEASQEHFDEAIHTLQSGFALVEHLNNEPTLVQGLVALAMANLLMDQVAEIQQAPGAPNLYWALSGLRHPLVDLRAMTEMEQTWLKAMLPELASRSPRQLTVDDFNSIVKRLRQLTALIEGGNQNIVDQLAIPAMAAMSIGPAKAWLTSHGMTQQQANALPPIQAVGIYFLESYQQMADDLYKWLALAYPQAHEGLRRSEQRLREQEKLTHNPLMSMLPALTKVFSRVALSSRRQAMLQTIDALRAYAAAHDGKLPASIDELKETPAPIDPVTGNPFDYSTSGSEAILGAAALKDMTTSEPHRIHITIGKR